MQNTTLEMPSPNARRASSHLGPRFRLVDTVSAEDLAASGGFRPRATPLLVKGALTKWPASERWTFEKLAELRRPDGSPVVTSFQNGLVEQGTTKAPLLLEIAPYLRELAQARSAFPRERLEQIGLLPDARRRTLSQEDTFHLDWSYLKTFEPNRAYLAQWYVLEEFPELRRDFEIKSLWPGLRFTWEYTFIGPADTVTGIHYDFPNNWFCQVSGDKEFLLFGRNQTPLMCKSRKYDWGATLSDIDITRLDQLPREAESFAAAEGWYARVESGDALFVPARVWHAVVALTPSISLAVFGLTPWEVVAGGGPSQVRAGLHALGLYRRNECTCHPSPDAQAQALSSGVHLREE